MAGVLAFLGLGAATGGIAAGGASLMGGAAPAVAAAGAGSGWLATAGNIAQLVGVGGGLVSEAMSSSQNASAANAEAKQLEYAARKNAEIGARAHAKQIAKGEATAAAGGVDIRSGSPLIAILDAAGEAERERLATLYGGQIKADAARRQAAMYRAQIPGQAFGAAAQTGKILSTWWGK